MVVSSIALIIHYYYLQLREGAQEHGPKHRASCSETGLGQSTNSRRLLYEYTAFLLPTNAEMMAMIGLSTINAVFISALVTFAANPPSTAAP